MAIYVCQIKAIVRSEGRSAVAAAAYRSGEKIKNQWDGVEHDYTRKGGIVYKNILLPDHAPQEYRNRATLWNAVEMSEKASDCRLCRECIVALPRELSLEQQTALVEEYVLDNFVKLGMCADIAIHNPVLTDDLHRPIDKNGNPTNDPTEYQYINPHAHILLTVRPIDEHGRWAAKTQKEYLCRRGKEQKGFTASEFSLAKTEGWEKQYRYQMDKKQVWLTPSEATAQGLTHQQRISRAPRSTPHGRENPVAAYWNDAKRVPEWRQAWAELVNRKFLELGIDERIDARSYAAQGIDRMPGVHEGPSAHHMKKRGCHTEKSSINAGIAAYNRSADLYRSISQAAQKKVHTTASVLENLRNQMIYSGYKGSVLGKSLSAAQRLSRQQEADIRSLTDILDAALALNEKATETIAALTKLLEATSPLQWQKRNRLKGQIDHEQQQVAQRSEYIHSVMRQQGYADEGALWVAAEAQAEATAELNRQRESLSAMEAEKLSAEAEYQKVLLTVPDSYHSQVDAARSSIREWQADILQQELRRELTEEFSPQLYREYAAKADEKLEPEDRHRKEKNRRTQKVIGL